MCSSCSDTVLSASPNFLGIAGTKPSGQRKGRPWGPSQAGRFRWVPDPLVADEEVKGIGQCLLVADVLVFPGDLFSFDPGMCSTKCENSEDRPVYISQCIRIHPNQLLQSSA